jgi:hypothetical protein
MYVFSLVDTYAGVLAMRTLIEYYVKLNGFFEFDT